MFTEEARSEKLTVIELREAKTDKNKTVVFNIQNVIRGKKEVI